MLHESVQTRMTALHWLYHLYVNLPSKVLCTVLVSAFTVSSLFSCISTGDGKKDQNVKTKLKTKTITTKMTW